MYVCLRLNTLVEEDGFDSIWLIVNDLGMPKFMPVIIILFRAKDFNLILFQTNKQKININNRKLVN